MTRAVLHQIMFFLNSSKVQWGSQLLILLKTTHYLRLRTVQLLFHYDFHLHSNNLQNQKSRRKAGVLALYPSINILTWQNTSYEILVHLLGLDVCAYILCYPTEDLIMGKAHDVHGLHGLLEVVFVLLARNRDVTVGKETVVAESFQKQVRYEKKDIKKTFSIEQLFRIFFKLED